MYNYDHIDDNSGQHLSADYWGGDTLEEYKKIHQQYHRPIGCKSYIKVLCICARRNGNGVILCIF